MKIIVDIILVMTWMTYDGSDGRYKNVHKSVQIKNVISHVKEHEIQHKFTSSSLLFYVYPKVAKSHDFLYYVH